MSKAVNMDWVPDDFEGDVELASEDNGRGADEDSEYSSSGLDDRDTDEIEAEGKAALAAEKREHLLDPSSSAAAAEDSVETDAGDEAEV